MLLLWLENQLWLLFSCMWSRLILLLLFSFFLFLGWSDDWCWEVVVVFCLVAFKPDMCDIGCNFSLSRPFRTSLLYSYISGWWAAHLRVLLNQFKILICWSQLSIARSGVLNSDRHLFSSLHGLLIIRQVLFWSSFVQVARTSLYIYTAFIASHIVLRETLVLLCVVGLLCLPDHGIWLY